MSLFGDPTKDSTLLNELHSIVEQLSIISKQLERLNQNIEQLLEIKQEKQ
ncbi:MAG: hypothetical protein N2450_05455 [bacterium]|nr:hypothetical protein [bacterium]